MLAWLIPAGVFWVLASLYLGGMNVEVEGGSGLRQLLGLLATFGLFMAVYAGLRAVLGGFAGLLGGIILPLGISALLLGPLARVGFRLLGVRVRKAGASHAH